jgi:DNA-binding transcriptional ArsR family regulator
LSSTTALRHIPAPIINFVLDVTLSETSEKDKSLGIKGVPVSDGRGRDRELTREDVLEILYSKDRPVWTASQIAERTDVSKTTAKSRLKELSETEYVDTVQVGNATAYYAVDTWSGSRHDISKEEIIRRSLKDHWEGRFIGGVRDMSVVHTHDGEELTSGDKIQIVVTGTAPSMKTIVGVFSGDELNEIPSDGSFAEEQYKPNEARGDVATAELGVESYTGPKALFSAELDDAFAVPLVEQELGNFETPLPTLQDGSKWKFEKEDGVPRLTVAGSGAYLLRPCEDAVFLKNVEVDDIDLTNDLDESILDTSHYSSSEDDEETLTFDDLFDE